MKVGYIDSSYLLSILLQDDNYELSIEIWNGLNLFLSSILLDVECRINIYKYYMLTMENRKLYQKKDEDLSKLLNSINKKNIDQEILLEIKNHEKLKHVKSLDSIHLATAHIFQKLVKEKLFICSYDKNMIKVAKELGMEIIHHGS